MSDYAKQAAEARAELQRVLGECAMALSNAGAVVTASAIALEHAAAREADATANYVAYLERQIANQKQLS